MANEEKEMEFDAIEMRKEMTEQVLFEHLSDAFIMLENLLTGAESSKDNINKIYEVLDQIKTITNNLKDVMVNIENMNVISTNIVSLNDTLKTWVVEESKMIEAMNVLVTDVRKINNKLDNKEKENIINFSEEKKESKNTKTSKNTYHPMMYGFMMCVILLLLAERFF